MLQQMPLAILAPSQRTSPGADWCLAAFSMLLSVRQTEGDVHLLAAASIRSDFHAHRRYSCGDGVRLWSRKSSRPAAHQSASTNASDAWHRAALDHGVSRFRTRAKERCGFGNCQQEGK